MNIGPAKGGLIASFIAERRPSTMIELGGYVGYSAIKFGDAVRRAGGQRYLSLEINPVYAAVANMLVDLAGLRDVVRIIVAPSHMSLAQLVRENAIDGVDILFFDHWKDRYLPDLWLVEQLGLLKPGRSVLVADNVLRPGAPLYLDWVRASPAEKREKLKEQSGLSVLKGIDDLAKAIKEKGATETGVDLANVPGNPNLVYESEIHTFSEEFDGVTVGSTSHYILLLLCYVALVHG
jgi:catechol O-methyltransferase